MERVSQVLHLSVIIERGWPPSVESQLFEKFDLRYGSIATQITVLDEPFEPWLFSVRQAIFSFNKLKFLWVPGSESAVQHNFNGKRRQVDVPGFDERIKEGVAVFHR